MMIIIIIIIDVVVVIIVIIITNINQHHTFKITGLFTIFHLRYSAIVNILLWWNIKKPNSIKNNIITIISKTSFSARNYNKLPSWQNAALSPVDYSVKSNSSDPSTVKVSSIETPTNCSMFSSYIALNDSVHLLPVYLVPADQWSPASFIWQMVFQVTN